MKWTPDTHDISFEIEGDRISIISCAEKYFGRDVREVYNEVVQEHTAINESNKKDEYLSGEVSLEGILLNVNESI